MLTAVKFWGAKVAAGLLAGFGLVLLLLLVLMFWSYFSRDEEED